VFWAVIVLKIEYTNIQSCKAFYTGVLYGSEKRFVCNRPLSPFFIRMFSQEGNAPPPPHSLKSKQQHLVNLVMIYRSHPHVDEMKSIDEWLKRLDVNAKVATVLGLIPASSDTVESEGRQIKQC
jgi:hypothetical protein